MGRNAEGPLELLAEVSPREAGRPGHVIDPEPFCVA